MSEAQADERETLRRVFQEWNARTLAAIESINRLQECIDHYIAAVRYWSEVVTDERRRMMARWN